MWKKVINNYVNMWINSKKHPIYREIKRKKSAYLSTMNKKLKKIKKVIHKNQKNLEN